MILAAAAGQGRNRRRGGPPSLPPARPPSPRLRTWVEVSTGDTSKRIHEHRDGQAKAQSDVSDSSGLQPIQIEHDAGQADVEEEGGGHELAGDGTPEEGRTMEDGEKGDENGNKVAYKAKYRKGVFSVEKLVSLPCRSSSSQQKQQLRTSYI